MKGTFVISLGGSLVVPEAIDTSYLTQFLAFIRGYVRQGHRFIIITGGGKIARRYQDAARRIAALKADDLDWLGIHATRLNAHLLRTALRDIAHPLILMHPREHPRIGKPVAIAAGWRPGFSTDYVAVRLAANYRVSTVLNLSNIAGVYSHDPKRNTRARLMHSLSWRKYLKIVGTKWSPGMNSPFDPVAAKFASRKHIRVVVCDGRDFSNIAAYMRGRPFRGTMLGTDQ